jgi:hypothetical protein
MLRRLPECHKRQACQLIPSASNAAKENGHDDSVKAANDIPWNPYPTRKKSAPTSSATTGQDQAENVLYRLPHDDLRDDKLTWAKTSTIEEWKKLGYVHYYSSEHCDKLQYTELIHVCVTF